MIFDRERPARLIRWALLPLILIIATTARLWDLKSGVPHAVGIDEPLVVDHGLRILRTGDWNPHIFNYPALVIYFQAAIDIVRFLWGALAGEWSSLDGFSIAAVYGADRLAVALIGVATVWLTYRLGVELGSRRVALFAGAQMAVRPMHVRESHFVLTDVPMTALVVLAAWCALRAGRLRTIRAYAWAGAVCGFAAAAQYVGCVAFVAVIVAWLLNDLRSLDRGFKIGAAAGAAVVAFLIAAPYTLLDLPSFLDGVASLLAQFAGPSGTGDPAWLLYAKHLWSDGSIPLTLALIAIPLVLVRGPARAWAPVIAFGAAYFYVLSSHAHPFGSSVLPLLPAECLLSSAAVSELLALSGLVTALSRPAVQRVLLAVAVVTLLYGPTAAIVRWLEVSKRPDTRTIAADWLINGIPKKSRVAVENSGPTYLDAAGFQVVATEVLFNHDAAWYRERADYLLISSGDLTRYGDLLGTGSTVFQISPTSQRLGPPIRIVRITRIP